MNETYLYPYSAKEARERNELSLWRESHRANIACRDAIEDTIRRSFDGMHLDKDCITPVLDEYGYKRTAWVLANTLHELKWDTSTKANLMSAVYTAQAAVNTTRTVVQAVAK